MSKELVRIAAGIDGGCNNIKIYFGNNEKLITRSTASTKPTVAAHLGMAEELDEIVLKINGKTYAVGPKVNDPLDTRFNGYHVSELNLALVCASLVRSKLDLKNTVIDACFGLPLHRFYKTDGTPRADLIAQRIEAWRRPVEVVKGKKKFPKDGIFGDLSGAAEGVGAYLDYRLDEEGNILNEPEGLTVVVDVGGSTTDIAIIEDGNVLFSGLSTSIESGALHLYQRVAELTQQHLDLRVAPSIVKIEDCIRNHSCNFKSGNISENIRHIVAQERSAVAEEIALTVEQRLTKRLDEVSRILYVGGGAELLGDELKDRKLGSARAIVPEDPQMANARGFYKFAVLQQHS
ncbi:ParM/StbA family protein [Pseudomonas aeruginosa]|nr:MULTISPECIES: ParM/StbA family protein [Pseudomonas aeruginosa group]EIU1445491.1 ParM/StbA family protein [Pseudomonas aeruginosa]EJH4818795.1 ParM/StbA family protein [Pseudomonas aeruginosa]EKL8566454.1 ParM/StbA family protein [Pseudomonas aeruginosa]EKS3059518.1 ParM/StbA family protein [Pseudomonas aeruginosa]EKU4838757.1 ParM/StbA family protein [Pseudomonas aeruginosa]